MSPTPQQALEAVAQLVNRAPLTSAELIGAQVSLNVLQAAITPKSEGSSAPAVKPKKG